MSGEVMMFLVLATIAIFGALVMLNASKVIHMLLALVLTFLSIAGLYVMLSAEFVAVVQVLIYSGAISIMMIFGIMLTKHHDEAQERKYRSSQRGWLVGVAMVLFFGIMYALIEGVNFGGTALDLHVENTKQIGLSLYAHYVIPFELVSIVLLVAFIGAILLAKREEDTE
ncbi:NADH-quinone oxidoreductase subunit J [Pontibacillus yanchengensis]|uniref:NADH-quinone oxidoreductase subunit J n=2 Tax=Pontibacillus yanchengensis TaxID=462910 RepID=A0A6I5A1F6_9BACI|nr:NADH-quinone oxidoreductase subunit J [Pontibacillus yanchengensis]MYL34233.1 NADH-quinone oxidoreductase subunit J [Pontibacillus yanchengensis]MYL53704.1 NADH-quinone oxidoreductase subunit J [Pontibacillus yanchengensis]